MNPVSTLLFSFVQSVISAFQQSCERLFFACLVRQTNADCDPHLCSLNC